MNSAKWSDEQLVAFLQNECSSAEASRLEAEIRANSHLRERLAQLQSASEMHSIGEIWRRHRLSCPSREELQKKIDQSLSPAESSYIDFHLEVINCEICQANISDLQTTRLSQHDSERRRQQIFESSAGHLSRRED